MEQKRKISVRKVMQALVTLVVTVACIVAITSATRVHNDRKVKDLDVRITNPKYEFIDEQEVKQILLNKNHLDIEQTDMKALDINRLEKVINTNPWVADAEVYIDNNKVLHADVTQRVPVVRIFDQSGNSYYLDNTLKAMPLSAKYIHYTTVVTNVPVLKEDSMSRDLKGQILAMVRHIESDTFWNAQISQVIVTNDRTFELVPVLGKQQIVFGDTANMGKKFDNLFAFYKKVLNRVGWDKYDVLDVRFNGQVVASPALAWKMPKDKMMSNMNWVKAIIDGGAKDSAKATVTTMPVASAAPVKPVAPVAAAPAKVVKPEPAAKKPEPKPKPKAATAATPVKKTEKKTDTITKKDIQAKPAVKDKKPADAGKQKSEKAATPKYMYQGTTDNNQ